MKRLIGFLALVCIAALVLSGCSTPQAEAEVRAIDVDLTQLSSTMVYAEVFNITNDPQPYLGKVMKLGGMYYSNYIEELEQTYHFVLISDAAACCEQGLEFVLPEGQSYPEVGKEVEIVGTFADYLEDGMSFCHVLADEITVR